MKAPAVVLGLGAAGLLLLAWLAAGPRTTATVPPPAVPEPDPTADFADPVEEAVFEIEDALADLSSQLVRGASAAAAFHLDAGYEGSALLREAVDPAGVAAGVQLRASGPDPDRVGRSEAVNCPGPPDRVSFKLSTAMLREGGLACRLAIHDFRREGSRALRTVSEGQAEFARAGNRWLLRRFLCESRRTQEGDVRFPEATDALGLRIPYVDDGRDAVQATFGRLFLGGIAAGDFDGDGLVDLFVPEVGSARLFRNEGGRFRDCTTERGIVFRESGGGALFLDIDNDGDLDVYVCRYRDETLDDPEAPREIPRDVAGARDGEPNQLWINQGNGTFREEAAARGVADTGWSLAAGFADYDRDGRPDLFVANDYGTPRLYRNLGKGFFEDATAKAGVGDAGFGMGVLWTDVDGNGYPDLYVSNMYSTAGNRILARDDGSLTPESRSVLLRMASGNTLFLNRGDGTFENITRSAGVGRAGWAWGAAAFDVDNDGLQELYVANGFRTSSFGVADL